MQSNRRKNIKYTIHISASLILILLFEHVLSDTEKRMQHREISIQGKTAQQAKNRRETPIKAPPVFVPKEKVSADKTVSFPTDI